MLYKYIYGIHYLSVETVSLENKYKLNNII